MIGYIYSIVNKIDGQRYVGQTIDIERRKRTHFSKLKNNTHPNYLLQEAWNTWGEESFIFEFKQCYIKDQKELDDLEKQEIKKYNSYENGYNRTLGGQGGPITRASITYEEYCFIYYGCHWQGMTEKIAKYLGIDSSTVSAVLRGKSYRNYLSDSEVLTQEEIQQIEESFRKAFNIPENKPWDENRIPTHLSQEEFFYCLCVVVSYGRGIEAALGKFFNKHKSFLSNGLKGKTKGKAYNAYQDFLKLSEEEIVKIGQQKFEEWELQNYSKFHLEQQFNLKWVAELKEREIAGTSLESQ